MTNERLPIGGCISELNCLQVRSSANVECVRDSQQHLREYGQLIAAHAAQSLELQAVREERDELLVKLGKHLLDKARAAADIMDRKARTDAATSPADIAELPGT